MTQNYIKLEEDTIEDIQIHINKIITGFPCRTHSNETVRSILFSKTADPVLVCFDCLIGLEESQKKNLIKIYDYFAGLVKSDVTQDTAPQTPEIPTEAVALLEKEKEYTEKFTLQVEKEKQNVIELFETASNYILQKLEEKRNCVLKQLEENVIMLNKNFSLLKANVERQNTKNRSPLTWHSLLRELKKMKKTTELETFLSAYKTDFVEKGAFHERDSEKAKYGVFEYVNRINDQLQTASKPLTKPTIPSTFQEAVSELADQLRASNPQGCVRPFGKPSNNMGICQEIAFCKHRSKILREGELKHIEKMFHESPITELALLYRGTMHGIEAARFHERCDGQGSTISLYCFKHRQNGILFRIGGYSDIEWKMGINSSQKSNASFLFSLKDFHSGYFKASIIDEKKNHAVYVHDKHFPTFGYGLSFCSDLWFNPQTGGLRMNPITYDVAQNCEKIHYTLDPKEWKILEIEVFKIRVGWLDKFKYYQFPKTTLKI